MESSTDSGLRSKDGPSLVSNNDIPAGATCRICRGEATADNPLFHPCKCKGSIKYLHEPCLLEWINSRNIDINKPGTSVNCDICHHPFQFRTTYVENMPDKIPVPILLKNISVSLLDRLRKISIGASAIFVLVVGLPLTWNFFGKLFTFILDGELPYHGNFLKSVIFGYNDELVVEDVTIDMIFLKLLGSIEFSTLQIILIVILHLALYFQYDMIVREDVFNKMVFHKIGPNISIEDFKNRLKDRFPMMDDEMLDHVARAMRERERRENQENDEQHHVAPPIPPAPVAVPFNAAVPQQENQEEGVQPTFENHDHDDTYNEEDDLDFIPNENETESDMDQLDSDNDTDGENFQFNENNPFDELMNRRAQRNFDNLIDQQRAMNINRPNAPIFIPPPPQPQQRDEEEQEQLQAQQAGPLMINFNLKLANIWLYFSVAIAIFSFYILISYFMPTFVGYGLLRVYLAVFLIFYRGLVHFYYFSKFSELYHILLNRIPYFADMHNWIGGKIIKSLLFYYKGYMENSLRSSIMIRALPSLTTYLTAIFIVCTSSELVCRGYGRENGMPNRTRRFIFQVLFALKCTFKVFTLFFIELAGFPVLAGVMLDISLFAPILNSSTDYSLWVPRLVPFWQKAALIIYWLIGTLYMYWFAKYIGMIREYIIRPGVLFFIRSPDDPNIKILHDSLIHPMKIQLSRLCLSMFIYAVFIVLGFGIHTRLLFPILLNSKILSTPPPFNVIKQANIFAVLFIFYISKRIIEENPNVKLALREYWIKIFEVASRRLRLSSFILGQEHPSETGHIFYRNSFYKFLAPERAKWSNPDLFTTAKTEEQAKILFKEDLSIHAYFIPDGILMRVPSSDIVSRNYVQTMFVPVTKDDQLLKPLDLERIKERNRRNAGEFGYLDTQNTDFDDYSICYVPPNFKFRYISLISLMWFFASVIILCVAIVSQYLFNMLITVTLLPVLWSMGAESELSYLKKLISTSYKQLNIHFVCFGAVLLSFALDYYKSHELSKLLFKEHAVIDQTRTQDGDEADGGHNAELANAAAPVQERPALLELIFENWLTKYVVQIALMCISSALKWSVWLLLGWFGFHQACYYLSMNLSSSGFKQLPSVTFFIISCCSLIDMINTVLKFFNVVTEAGNASCLELIKAQWRVNIKPTSKSLIAFLSVILPISTFFSYLEYRQNINRYISFPDAIVEMTYNRMVTQTTSFSKIQHCYHIVSLLLFVTYSIQRANENLQKWLGTSVQDVKDRVYASGRSLENYTNDGDA